MSMYETSITALRRFLFDLPARLNFSLTDDIKIELRKQLFKTVSCGGNYLSLLFPEIFHHSGDDVHKQLDSVVQWLLIKYTAHVAKQLSTMEGRNHHAYHTALPCARVFRRGEPIYKCLTCGFNDTCAMCANCFQPESHEGHNTSVSICVRENGGVCDCGDPEAWVNDFRCVYHETNESFEKLKNMTPSLDLQKTLTDTVGAVLDYVIDVMCQSDQQFNSAQQPDAKHYSKEHELDPLKYGYFDSDKTDKLSQKFSLIAYNDQVRHFRDAVQRIHLASKKVPEFAEMVAKRIQDHGRATVVRSREPDLLFERQKLLSATGLSSCIRNSRDEFREEICFEIIQWLESLSSCDLLKANEPLRNLFCGAFCKKWERGVRLNLRSDKYERGPAQLDFNLNIPSLKEANSMRSLPWEHIEPLCLECGYSVFDTRGDGHIGSRLQYLAYLDIRFWKAFRLALHTMYATTLITNLKWKGMICYQYCDIYPFIAEMFLNLDGDPENNIMCTLSCQLFVSPSNSSALLSHGDVARIFGTVLLFLKSGRTHSAALNANTDLSLNSLKNRRWGQLFFDIGYIVSRGQNSDVSLTDSMVPMTCDILALFQGKPTMKREIESHVEYESSDYTAYFHAIPIIYQLAEYVTQCLKIGEAQNRKKKIFQSAIRHVVKVILQLENLHPSRADHNEVDYGIFSRSLSRKQGDANSPVVSFLHPLHLFLSWLIEYASFKDSDELIRLLQDASINATNNHSDKAFEDSLTCIFHYPVQSIVLAAQVKTGFWVRNGFSVRNQLQLYKSTGLREQGYLRDVFLTQIYLICQDVDKAVETILRLWLLNDDFSPERACPYDSSTLPYILDECLSFFLHILTEGLFMRSLTVDEITRVKIEDEIIHQLCLGSMNYTKLCSQIPEHIVSEKFFDSTLERVALFRKPTSGKESGTFVLKDEYYKRVNPYYHNYSLNKRDEVLKLMKERVTRSSEQPLIDVVIEPAHASPGRAGIYHSLGRFTSSQYFVKFLVTCLRYVLLEGSRKLDALLDTLLHVVHTCASEQWNELRADSSFCQSAVGTEVGLLLSLASTLYTLLLQEEVKEHHAKVRAIFSCLHLSVDNFYLRLERQIPNFDLHLLHAPCNNMVENDSERKKRLATRRQEKLMAKFKKQQALFLQQNDLVDDCSDTEMEDADEDGWKFPTSHCILCQDTAKDAGPFGLIVHVSRSSEFREIPFEDDYWLMKAFSGNANLDRDENHTYPEAMTQAFKDFMKNVEEDSVIGPGFKTDGNVSSKLVSLTCGHGMHFNCYIQFLASNRSRSNHITRNTPDNIEHREFLCPLCKALNNMFVPILWTANSRSLKDFLLPPPSNLNAFDGLLRNNLHDKNWFHAFCKAASNDLQEYAILTNVARDIIGQDSESLTSSGQQQFRILLSNMFQILSLLTFPQIFKADSSNILVNTIKATEISLRGIRDTSGLVYHQISNNALINLRALNEFRITSLMMKTSNWVKNSYQKPDTHVKILANLLTLSAENFDKSILQHDFLEILVNVFPMPSAGYSFHEILRVCFIGHVIQTLNILTTKIEEKSFFKNDKISILDIPFSEMIAPDDACTVLHLFKSLLDPGSLGRLSSAISSEILGYVLYSMLLKSVTPFLRQATIFAFVNCHFDSGPNEEIESSIFEADKLCATLKLPTLSESLRSFCNYSSDSSLESRRFRSFLAHLHHEKDANTSIEKRTSLEYPGVILLLRLPVRLDDFFTQYYYLEKFDFPHLSIENPAVCMFCGDVCDLQRTTLGSRDGQCTTHYTKKCQNSVGIFLLPKDRSILLLNKNGGSFHAIPYIDLHFEVAGDNKKTRAVYLLQERYDEFVRSLWLQHNIPNYIVRRLDGVIDAGGWETL